MKKIIIIFFTGLLCLLPQASRAYYYPNNSSYIYYDVANNTKKQVLIATSTNTILAIGLRQSSSNITAYVYCGGDEIFDNAGIVDTWSNLISHCDKAVYIQRTGASGTVNANIIYTNYNLALIPDYATTTGTTGTSTPFNMPSDIGTIGFIATTSGGVTSGIYYVPFILFVYATILILIITILTLYLINKYIKK